MRFLGWDLTDPYARIPRPVDVAEVDARGQVRFSELRWPVPSKALGFTPELLRASFPLNPEDVLVIDGPQALARPGASVREAERCLRAPGRTPDVLPEPGRPFAGFVRGGVLLFAALHARGGHPLLDVDTDSLEEARLFEAFPGATWRALSVEKLGKKTSHAGRTRRQAVLEARGLRFPPGLLPTHDQLDAALCAWLGWLTRKAPTHVTAVGAPLTVDNQGWLREGRILSSAHKFSTVKGLAAQ
ncbi:hypothetical protein MXAN_0020 [Myxococcus xanthus DK 1622]|uniref:DUF429 domain-containing protein n=1 Tax=Myxococcus xanthus (strain DK1622) TaxID=246197 RepID=Q1DGC0_MYXXD|nr:MULTISPECIES: DUF429 domain-containing protein [Myxococcus]ABF86164.1 hypothetical protein MXAN_0020 [Myxococcus xanthus DK 1622]NOJ54800.1 DUF429 domain-containing protein [Myxococcus xanthus]QPM79743.1 DUF429 domain-containing protein [Myxococcus xanthus]QVW68823.1 DUF429 domain-containing protein [Myxococcus xanthus DZ2]QZZ47583.1 hypothetical protein MyxoNM_00105 [Myxococcus xanthus]